MIRIDEGGEYEGELYIFCDAHDVLYFEGRTLEELKAFIAEHESH
jgi:hypothetical protein